MIKHEHKISWKVLKIIAQKCSNGDLGLTLTILMARSKLLFRFIQMMNMTIGLYTQMSYSGPHGPLVYLRPIQFGYMGH